MTQDSTGAAPSPSDLLNPLGAANIVSQGIATEGISGILAGTAPMFLRIGLGAGGVGLMIIGLLIMGASSKTGGQVINGAVAGAGIAGPGAVGKAIGKAAVAA